MIKVRRGDNTSRLLMIKNGENLVMHNYGPEA